MALIEVDGSAWLELIQENAHLHGLLDAREQRALAAEEDTARLHQQLAPLCPCDPNPETTDGPQRECPLHGDGVTFVAHVRLLEALLAAAYAYIPEVESGERFGDLFDAVHALRKIEGVA